MCKQVVYLKKCNGTLKLCYNYNKKFKKKKSNFGIK